MKRHLRWLPLAFLAGIHGFAYFALYAAVMLIAAHFLRRRRTMNALTA
jgi:hypothetical protein